MCEKRKKLRYLNIEGCSKLTDNSFNLIAKNCTGIRHLHLGGHEALTNAGLISIAKSCQKLRTLTIANCPRVGDEAVSTITTKLLNLRTLHLKNVKTLRDKGLKTLHTLRSLTALDLSGCTRLTDQVILCCPSGTVLITVNLSKLPNISDESLARIAKRNPAIQSVDVSNCKNITSLAIASFIDAVSANKKIQRIAVKGCPNVNKSQIDLAHSDLIWDNFDDRDSPSEILLPRNPTLHCRIQREHEKYLFRLQHSAKAVQRSYRNLIRYRVDTKALREQNRHRVKMAVRIQSLGRIPLAKRRTGEIRAAKGKVALLLGSRFLFLHLRRINVQAAKLSRDLLYKRSFRRLRSNVAESRHEKAIAREILNDKISAEHYMRTHRNKHFRFWKSYYDSIKHDLHKNAFANAHWKKHMLPVLMATWKEKTKFSIKHRKKLSAIFMHLTPISHDNSYQQIVNREKAISYSNKTILTPVWGALMKNFEEFSDLKRKAKLAAEHAKATNEKKLLVSCFGAFLKHKDIRKYKRVMMRRGHGHFIRRSKRVSTRRLCTYAKSQIQMRKDIALAVEKFNFGMMRINFLRLNIYKRHRLEMKERKAAAQRHFDLRATTVLAAFWMDYTIRSIDNKRKTAIANKHFNTKILIKIYQGWKEYSKHAGDAKALAAAKQARILCGKTFAGWKRFWKDACKAKRMAEEVAARDEAARQKLYDSQTNIARVWRGFKDRKETSDYRVFRDWAVIRCQCQYRVFHAKKVLLKRKRWFLLKQNLVEEVVEEEMAREEKYMRWWVKMEGHAITVKRVTMGHIGRIKAYARRQQRFREKGLDFQVEKRRQYKYHTDQVMLRARLLVLREESARLCQKTYRGILGRRRFNAIKQAKLEREIAMIVQAAFRGKQGRRKSYARRRHLLNMERVRQARQIQAKVLRGDVSLFGNTIASVGFRQRKTQRAALKILRALGFDSMSFTQKFRQQIKEIHEDMQDTIQSVNRSVSSWKEGKFDPYVRDKTKRRMLAEYMESRTVKTSSAVRIIQKNHQYTGLTGQVVQIDRSFPNKAVAEVRMDVDGQVIYYRLITESTMYEPPQPSMHVIPTLETQGVAYKDVVRCKEFILNWAAEERVKRTQYKAARQIQQIGRAFMAKTRVAKIRYVHWAKLLSNRNVVLHALNQYGAANTQAARTLLTMHFARSTSVPILWEKPEVPPRIEESLTKRALSQMLNLEFREKISRRLAHCKLNNDRFSEGSYMHRVRKFSPMIALRDEKLSALQKFTTSAIAEKVHESGGDGSFLERVALFFGGKEYKRSEAERHAWLKRCTFEQMEQSPHVRMKGLALYHGVFHGNPRSTEGKNAFRPHGEGFVEFVQGFGVGREEKTLKITITQARELRAADFNNSDPFAVVLANRRKVRTKTIMKTLDPVWNESFEIDVTDPYHIVKVVVYDWDKWSSNDFLGQVVFPIADLADGKKVKKWYKLIQKDNAKSDNKKKTKKEQEDENDLGDIELEMQWTEREDSDDIDRRRLQHKNCIMLQCWSRQALARLAVRRAKERVKKQIATLSKSAIYLQCAYRIRMARMIVKSMKKSKKYMTRIQCACRQKLARRKTTRARLEYYSCRSIQCCIRKAYARMIICELRRIRNLLLDECAATIQRKAKVMVSHALVNHQRQHLKEKGIEHPSVKENLETMSTWMPTYGFDPVYKTKRLRRICLKTFSRVLSVRGSTVVTRFGEAAVEQFPAPYLESRDGHDFATVRLYAHTKLSCPFAERKVLHDNSPKFFTAIQLEAISIRDTVDLRIIQLQSYFRVKISENICKQKRKARNAAIFVQRKYRWRFGKKEGLAMMVQCLYRVHVAYEELKFKKMEVIKAEMIQAAYRIHLGRLALEEKRRISLCQVLDSSGDLNELFDATKTLDGLGEKTFWCSPPKAVSSQWISYDLTKKYSIGKVKLLAPNNTSSPKEVLVECANRVAGPWKPIETLPVLQKSGWQSFDLPKTVCRFFRLSFKKNYGNAQAVSLFGVGFFIAKEITAHVIEEPTSLKVDPGPPVGKVGGEIILTCKAAGWPPPTYQWTKNGKEMEGETMPSLKVVIKSSKSKILKRFRCIHCKKINTELPENIYRVVCSNCKYPFDFPEVEEAADMRRPLELEVEEVGQNIKSLKARRSDLADDIKALVNKRKMREYAAAKGESLMEDSEVKEGEKNAENMGLEQQLSMIDSMGNGGESMVSGGVDLENTGNLKNGVLVKNNPKQRYRAMMKDFTEIDEESVFDDDESLGESSVKTAGNASIKSAGQNSVQSLNKSIAGAKGDENVGSVAGNNSVADGDETLGGDLNLEEQIDEEEEDEEAKHNAMLAELTAEIDAIDEKLKACDKKNWWLMRKRLEAGEFDPCKVKYEGEGVYQCVVSNIRGGEIKRSNKTRPAVLFVDDPVPQVIKVREEYHLKIRLRRRNWPKYLSLFGWFVDGRVLGDCVIRYHSGDIYDGPYVDERWISWIGGVVKEAYDDDHWGVWVSSTDTIYEGPNVCNHFDETNIQGEYRVTYENGEVYEGQYVDENRHGIGEYHYGDGSIYEGEWYKGKRQGFGVFTNAEGDVYEGEWDRDFIHGEGIWRWIDGSTYMGDNIDGKRSGKGVYITLHGDVYIGDFHENKMHGTGTFTYNDKTVYEGTFRDNLREGEGVFSLPNGIKDIGPWRNDKRDGEFVVRRPVYSDDPNDTTEWDDEVQRGIWVEGEFDEWCAPPVNPKATMQFIDMFLSDDDEFDGVYAMLIARRLPLVPLGVQGNHPEVQRIMSRIAAEGGHLVAIDTYAETKTKIKAIEKKLNEAKVEFRHWRVQEEHVDELIAKMMRKVDGIKRKIDALAAQEKTYEMAIESFWLEDTDNTRDNFLEACKNLEPLQRTDWFQLRHYHEPPLLIESVMSAVCLLMLEEDTWKSAQQLLGNSQQNRDDGDQESIWQEYDVKMLHLLENFDVFERTESDGLLSYVGTYLVDPRFKSDNYFLQSFGPAAIKLVEWIWKCYAYVKKAKEIKPKSDSLKALQSARGRFQNNHDLELEGLNKYENRVQPLRKKVSDSNRRKDRWQDKYDKMEQLLMECQNMIVEYTSEEEGEMDEIQKMLEAEGEIKSTTENIMELMICDIEEEDRMKEEAKKAQKGYVEEEKPDLSLDNFISKAVNDGRKQMFRMGDYKFSGGELLVGDRPCDIAKIQRKQAENVREQINFVSNEFPDVREWRMLDGSIVTTKHLQNLIQMRWTKLDESEALDAAEKKWENVFSKNTAYAAVQSRTNFIQTDAVKREAQIWMDRHREQVTWTENWIANNFLEENSDDTARIALEIKDDKRLGVDAMCAASVWCRLNREEVLAELDKQNAEKARKFAEAHPDDTAKIAMDYRKEAAAGNEVEEIDEAEAWISLHMEEVVETEVSAGIELSRNFVEKFTPEEFKDGKDEGEKEEGEEKAKDDAPVDNGEGKGRVERKSTTFIPSDWANASNVADEHDAEEMTHFHDLEVAMETKAKELQTALARVVIEIKKDENSSREDREMALAWAALDENKEPVRLSENAYNKEKLHDDLVRGTTIDNTEKEIDSWQAAMDMRKRRLGIPTSAEIEERNEALLVKRAERARARKALEEKERLEEEEERKKKEKKNAGKKSPGKKSQIEKIKEEEKRKEQKRRDDLEKELVDKEEEENKQEEITDEGVLKLSKNIVNGRKKIIKLCKERIKYNDERLKMFKDRQESILLDKSYLEVPDAIRPSEAKIELKKAKMLRDDRLKFLVKAIKELTEILEDCEKRKTKHSAELVKEGEDGGDGGGAGGEEWTEYYDEQAGAWAYYNNITGESVWAE